MYSSYRHHSLLCINYCLYVYLYELSMSITMVQCSVHKVKNKGQETDTKTHQILITHSETKICNIFQGFDTDVLLWSDWDLSHSGSAPTSLHSPIILICSGDVMILLLDQSEEDSYEFLL